MPVRKIPRNHLVTTGRVARPNEEPAEYEGTLENDYYVLLKHDPGVLSFVTQPVKVPLGNGRFYTPDVLVHFKQPVGTFPRPSELTEIKPANLLIEKADEYAPKFAAAEAYCRQQKNWIFVKKTRENMDLVRLENIRNLRAFLRNPINVSHHALVADTLGNQPSPISVNQLLSLCSKSVEADELVSTIWRGVMSGDLQMNLSEAVTMDSLISIGESSS